MSFLILILGMIFMFKTVLIAVLSLSLFACASSSDNDQAKNLTTNQAKEKGKHCVQPNATGSRFKKKICK